MTVFKKTLSATQREDLLRSLKQRFENNMNRHSGLEWESVSVKLEARADILWSLHEMEKTGGEPDVVEFDKATGAYVFYDCSPESPKGRRSLCYDRAAWDERKSFKPKNNAIDMAEHMGIKMLTEDQYRKLQEVGSFDLKTSSWIETPEAVRKLGGALFADRRYDNVFVYHNGAQSYYSSRGFRGSITL